MGKAMRFLSRFRGSFVSLLVLLLLVSPVSRVSAQTSGLGPTSATPATTNFASSTAAAVTTAANQTLTDSSSNTSISTATSNSLPSTGENASTGATSQSTGYNQTTASSTGANTLTSADQATGTTGIVSIASTGVSGIIASKFAAIKDATVGGDKLGFAGNQSRLLVSSISSSFSDSQSLIAFSFASVFRPGLTVSAAEVQLVIVGPSPVVNLTVEVHSVMWSEMLWHELLVGADGNLPRDGFADPNASLQTLVLSGSTPLHLSFDVTTFALANVIRGLPWVNLVLRNANQGFAEIASREHPNATIRPILDLVLEPCSRNCPIPSLATSSSITSSASSTGSTVLPEVSSDVSSADLPFYESYWERVLSRDMVLIGLSVIALIALLCCLVVMCCCFVAHRRKVRSSSDTISDEMDHHLSNGFIQSRSSLSLNQISMLSTQRSMFDKDDDGSSVISSWSSHRISDISSSSSDWVAGRSTSEDDYLMPFAATSSSATALNSTGGRSQSTIRASALAASGSKPWQNDSDSTATKQPFVNTDGTDLHYDGLGAALDSNAELFDALDVPLVAIRGSHRPPSHLSEPDRSPAQVSQGSVDDDTEQTVSGNSARINGRFNPSPLEPASRSSGARLSRQLDSQTRRSAKVIQASPLQDSREGPLLPRNLPPHSHASLLLAGTEMATPRRATSKKARLQASARMDIGFAETRGRRDTMEDKIVILGCFRGRQDEELLCIFDGHGGNHVAHECASRLPKILQRLLDENEEDVEGALAKCFEETHQKIFDAALAPPRGGATALVAYFKGSYLWIANAGDTRAVIAIGEAAVRLSVDHKPDVESERLRIEDRGGAVTTTVDPDDGYVEHRVNGVLAVSRSIGDFQLNPFVVPTPHIVGPIHCDSSDTGKADDVAEPGVSWLILACDGLWDEVDDTDAVEMIARSQCTNAGDAAVALRDAAFDRGSEDNISVIVANLKCLSAQKSSE